MKELPNYFKTALGKIPIPDEKLGESAVYLRTYKIGEAINEAIASMIQDGMANGDLRANLSVMQTVFVFWSSLSGIIQLASDKKEYLEQRLPITIEEYLQNSFGLLYQSIERGEC